MNCVCQHCGQKCQNSTALKQHENSPAHNLKCTACNRIFKTQLARQQHMNVSHPKAPSKASSKTPSKASSKAPSYKCVKCNGSFGSTQALQQHSESPAHDPALHSSKRPFSDRQALQQNLMSPTYAPVLICNVYSRPFDGQHTLQHVGHSSAQVPSYDHTNFNRPSNGLQSLQQQTTDSKPYTIPSSSQILPNTAVSVECVPKPPKNLEEMRVEPQQGLRPEMERTMNTLPEQDDSVRPANQPFQYN